MMDDVEDTALPCGRDAVEVHEQAEHDEHSLTCGHCTEVIDAARGSVETIRELLRSPENAAVDPSAIATIMGEVHAELRPGRLHPLTEERVSIAEAALRNAVRALIDEDERLHARRVRITHQGQLNVEAEVVVRPDLGTPGGAELPGWNAVQDRLRGQLGTLLGLPLGEVTVIVEDSREDELAPLEDNGLASAPHDGQDELRRLVVDAARSVEGVRRLHTVRDTDGRRVDVGVQGLTVLVRLITSLRPSPRSVAASVKDAVGDAVFAATGRAHEVGVDVVDVHP